LPVGRAVESVIPVTYHVPAVILAQFTVATAFAVRTMRVAFDQIDPRAEQVALTLGCTRSQAFWRVTVPAARRGVLAAATLAWARSIGEFGPVQIFAGATPMKTIVLPTAVYFEAQLGRLSAALAVSLVMVAVSIGALVLTRLLGLRNRG
jgi:molybdate transport system permease protein